MPRPPLVAVPTYRLPAHQVENWGDGGYALPLAYVVALRAAGLEPLLVPGGVEVSESVDGVLAVADGLLLPGGGDVEPARYGASPHPEVYGVDPERDRTELALLAGALDRGLPVLAICRGAQLLNVAHGGSLHQHLPADERWQPHGNPTAGRHADHPVSVAPGSRLSRVASGGIVEACRSWHHQGIDRLGDGLVPAAWTADGLVEAVELLDDHRWVVGVQWHPEATAAADPRQEALFVAFADEVRAGARAGTR